MNLEQIRDSLTAAGIKFSPEKRNGNNTGFRLECEDGALVNVYDSGSITVQGKNAQKIKEVLGIVSNLEPSPSVGSHPSDGPKVFVVYGHDLPTRHELEAMLRRWQLEPVILGSLPSAGATLIEKLETYCKENEVSYAVVLATPDDIGYPKGHEDRRQPRARQNVVLELGIVLAKLGRKRVAIFRPPKEDMEAPSDIDGLVYLEYKESLSEKKAELAAEMENAISGFKVTASRL